MTISISIPGEPVTSTAQQKRAVAIPGKGIRFFKKAAYSKAEASLVAQFAQHAPNELILGPVAVSVRFVFGFRKTEPKKRRALAPLPHDKRVDLDNLSKLYLDCLAKAGIIGDDAQIYDLDLSKYWDESPSVEIELTTIRKP